MVNAPDGSEILAAAVSDGAGTASRSDTGSALATSHFLERFAAAAASGPDLSAVDRAFVDRWFLDLREAIHRRAAEDGAAASDYACTMLGVLVGRNSAAYLQIGDGAIVVSGEEPGNYHWIFWPQHGEFANSTYFVTQDGADAVLQFETGGPVDEVALFSDGIERLVLDMSARTVHSPAFRPIFDWLAGTEPDRSASQSAALSAYLASDHINRRTDDDKTLVMATRVVPPGAA